MSRFAKFAAVVATTLVAAQAASAQMYSESGDADDGPVGAQLVGGSGPLTSIAGTMVTGGDVDSYRITIASPSTFSASTATTTGAVNDTVLFLFNLDGTGIAKNDDISGSNFRSTLPAGNALYTGLAPGEYILSVSVLPLYPFRVANPTLLGEAIFDINNFTGVIGPLAASVNQPTLSWVAAFSDAPQSGPYTITLTGAEFVVPEPTTLGLLAGVSAFAMRRRRA
jgi:PEP-CTERM motif